MHHRRFRKTQGVADARTTGKVTGGSLIAIRVHADIMRAIKLSFFFKHLGRRSGDFRRRLRVRGRLQVADMGHEC
jgi:hypothetical protein